jgi:hypothetical protein
MSALTAVAIGIFFTSCSSNTADSKYVTPDNIEAVTADENLIYSTSDSESGSVGVYYTNGTWVTLSNGEMYIIQQYLAPVNKNGTLRDEVKDLPGFNEDDITYKAMSNDTQTVYQLNAETVYTDISTALNTTNFSVFIEWSNNDYYYSYVMQYGDVSIFYTYSDESCLFRSYVQYLQDNTDTTIDAAGDSDKNSTDDTETDDSDTVEEIDHDGLYGSSDSDDTDTTTEASDDSAETSVESEDSAETETDEDSSSEE